MERNVYNTDWVEHAQKAPQSRQGCFKRRRPYTRLEPGQPYGPRIPCITKARRAALPNFQSGMSRIKQDLPPEVRLACDDLCQQMEQLVEDLGADRRLLALASSDEISVSQLEQYKDIFDRIKDLTARLHLVGNVPLSLTEARALYGSMLLHVLHKILSRLQWRELATQLDALHLEGRGCILAGCALSCAVELFHAWCRTERSTESNDHHTAQQETFLRY